MVGDATDLIDKAVHESRLDDVIGIEPAELPYHADYGGRLVHLLAVDEQSRDLTIRQLATLLHGHELRTIFEAVVLQLQSRMRTGKPRPFGLPRPVKICAAGGFGCLVRGFGRQ